MNRFFMLFISFSLCVFLGCDEKQVEKDDFRYDYDPFVRNLTAENLQSMQFAYVDSYDIGWVNLVLSSVENTFAANGRVIFFSVDTQDGKIKEGTYSCKDTDSFKRYAGFKCNGVKHIPDDQLTVTKTGEDHYSISYAYTENEQRFVGVYSGLVTHRYYAIDYAPECYQ